MKLNENLIWNTVRLLMSCIFIWAFVDKVFGFGFATLPAKAWLAGNSPTAGFLTYGAKGLFAPYFHALAGNIVVDYLFMMGLVLVGLSLVLGIGLRIASIAGSLLLGLIYLSIFPPTNNPVVDEHIIYIVILWGIYLRSKNQSFAFSKQWSKLSLVKKYPILL